MKCWLTYLLILFSFGNGFTQNEPSNPKNQPFSVISRGYYGFIVPHRSGLDNLILGHSKIVEISFNQQTLGNKSWQTTYSNPNIGLSVLFIDMANPNDLGYGLGVFPYINYPIFTTEKIKFNIRVAFGAVYASSPFRQGLNKNIIYGSNLNALVNFLGEAHIKLNGKIQLMPGISFTHFSNGAWRLPNLGVNIASINLGIGFGLSKNFTPVYSDSLKEFKPYVEITTCGGIGGKENFPINGTRYFVATGNIELAARISPMSQFYIGVDEFYNTSVKPYMEKELATPLNGLDILQTGIIAGYGLKMDKLFIGFGWGTYIRTKVVVDKRFYHKLILNYYINNQIFFKFHLKSHFARADFFEIGIGYRLWKSN